MSKYCVTTPRVRNKNNELVDSRLYKDLLSYTKNRDEATKLYLKVTNDLFKEAFDNVKYDENGEPLIESLIKDIGIDNYISTEDIINKEMKELKGIDKEGNPIAYEDNLENRKDLSYKTLTFNNRSPFKNELIAVIRPDEKGAMNIVVERKNAENQELADKIRYSHDLTQRLEDVLRDWGISIGVLTALDKAKGLNGIADFNNMRETAEGLIELIRIADNKEGLKALPEEVAHIAIEAISDNPLIERLIDNLEDRKLYEEVLGEELESYSDIYNNDPRRLAKEAAAKLIALLMSKTPMDIKSTPVRRLLDRVINYFKSIFNKFSPNRVRNEMLEAEELSQELAQKILNKEMSVDIELKDLANTPEYYNVKSANDKNKALLLEMVDISLKRFLIYRKQNPDSAFNAKGVEMINSITQDLENNRIKQGIATYISYSLEHLKLTDARLDIIDGDSGLGLNEKAGILLEARNFIKSFEKTAESMSYVVEAEKEFFDPSNKGIEQLLKDYGQVVELVNKLNTKYYQSVVLIYQEVIAPFVGEGFEIPVGRHKGKEINMNEVTYTANEDISKFELFLDSIVDSSDYALKSLGIVFQKQNEKARLDSLEYIRELKAAGLRLELAGIKDTEWMIERDSDGNQGYNYISEINWTDYYKKRTEARRERDEMIEKEPSKEPLAKKIYSDWLDENTNIVNGKTVPKTSIYGNKEFQEMMNSNDEESIAKREYYNTIIKMKAEMEKYLPERAKNATRRVFIRKGTWERMKGSDSVVDAFNQAREAAKDRIMERSDDVEMRSKNTLFDFDSNEVMSLPLFYINKAKDESINDYATDVTSSMIIYADMASTYRRMSEIVNIMEVAKDVLAKREVTQRRGDMVLKLTLNALGAKKDINFTKEGKDSNIFKRYEEFLKTQLYKKSQKDSGSVKKVNVNKAVGLLMTLASVKALGVNFLQAAANVLTGHVQGVIEGAANQHFSVSDLYRADASYFNAAVKHLSKLGNRANTDKLAIWNETFNTMLEHENEVYNNDFFKNTWLKRFMNTSTLFALSSMGENWLQTRTSIAMARNYNLIDSRGNEISLWDAVELVPIDPNNESLGMKLEVPEGITKQDGSKFTEKDAIDFSLKVKEVNRSMHGTYNKMDSNVINTYALGRMLTHFRKWMRDYYMKRYGRSKMNFETGEWEEGYYKALGRLSMALLNDAKTLQFNIMMRYDELSENDKLNVRRALTDLSITLILRGIIMGLFSGGDDDDKDSWWWDMFEYLTRRLLTETGGYSPVGLGYEGIGLIDSPAASYSTFRNIMDMIGLLNPYNYQAISGDDAIVKSGKYKGKSKAQRLWLRSPFVPVYDNIKKVQNPRESMGFFK